MTDEEKRRVAEWLGGVYRAASKYADALDPQRRYQDEAACALSRVMNGARDAHYQLVGTFPSDNPLGDLFRGLPETIAAVHARAKEA